MPASETPSSSAWARDPPTAICPLFLPVQPLLQNVFFHNRRDKASDLAPGAEGLPGVPGGDRHVQAFENMQRRLAEPYEARPRARCAVPSSRLQSRPADSARRADQTLPT